MKNQKQLWHITNIQNICMCYIYRKIILKKYNKNETIYIKQIYIKLREI